MADSVHQRVAIITGASQGIRAARLLGSVKLGMRLWARRARFTPLLRSTLQRSQATSHKRKPLNGVVEQTLERFGRTPTNRSTMLESSSASHSLNTPWMTTSP